MACRQLLKKTNGLYSRRNNSIKFGVKLYFDNERSQISPILREISKGSQALGVTVADVARVAKVSATTVSLCFQEESRISEKTRGHVLGVASQLGYVPNQFARRLRAGKTRLIALLVAEMHSPSIIDIISGVERIGIENNYNVLVFNTFRNIEIERRIVQSVSELNVEGIIVMASEEENPKLLQLAQERFPLVYLNSLPPLTHRSHIIYDMEAISRMAMEYLLRLGHRRILLVNSEESSKNFSSFALLEREYRRILEQEDIPFDPALIRYSGTTIQDGQAAVEAALSDGVEFSAVLAICDEAALGAIECLESHGKKVPEDVSVLGIDNIDISALSRIGLTTIAIENTTSQEKNLGVIAARALLAEIEQGEEATTISIALKPRLAERRSCRAI